MATTGSSITDNADPMNVVVYTAPRRREICRQPVFEQGAGSTDNSLIGAGHSIVVENNYGYTGPTATELGARTEPGIERVDIDADGEGCRKVWHSDEISPSLVPKLSLGNGLVYVYTQDPRGRHRRPMVPDRARLPHRRDRLEAPDGRGAAASTTTTRP